MFNLLCMDLRRLTRTRSFYIILAVTMVFIATMIAMLSAMSNPEQLDALQDTGMVVTSGSSEELREELRGMTQLDFIHECLGSGFLLMMTCIGMVLLVHRDFSSGYVKNICFVRPRRWEYVLSKLLVTGVYSGILIILGVLLCLGCPLVVGIQLAASPIPRILQYAFWLWFPHWAFGLMGQALVLLTRGSTLGIVMAVVSGGGLTAAFLQTLCQRFGWPSLAQYTLSMVVGTQCVPMLGMEQMMMILACAAGWGLAYAAGSLILMEKRDI